MKYYLTKFGDVGKNGFWVILKITAATLCNPIHEVNILLPFVLLNLEGVEKKQKKLQKYECISQEWKEISRWNKNHFL